jgi:hypothetical protein
MMRRAEQRIGTPQPRPLELRSEVQCRRDGVGGKRRHDATGGAENRNTAAATAQVQSRLAAPSAEAVIERPSTMRSLNS